MNKYLTLLSAIGLITCVSSCHKNSDPATQPDKSTTIDKTLLTGWWVPTAKNDITTKAYFGTDGFFYSDNPEVNSPPTAGFWKLGADSIYYSSNKGGAVLQTFIITKLTADSLILKIKNSKLIFGKTNEPAITSSPISTIAGNGVEGYTGDGGLAINAQIAGQGGIITDKQGNIYFADQGNRVIRKISVTDGKITTVAGTGSSIPKAFINNVAATSADLFSPAFLAMDNEGNIYYSESVFGNAGICKISVADNKITCVAGTLTGGPRVALGDGGLATNANLNEPAGIALDADGNLYIADVQNYRIRKVTATDGKITTIAGTGTTGFSGDGGPATLAKLSVLDVAVDANNNVYFTDFMSNRIRKIAAGTGIITTITGNGDFSLAGDGGLAINAKVVSPYGLKVLPNGDIYFVDAGSVIRKISGNTNVINRIAGTGFAIFTSDGIHATAYNLWRPYDVAVDLNGNVFINEQNRIRKVAK